MSKSLRWLTVLLVLGVLVVGAYSPIKAHLAERNRIDWRSEKVSQGNIKSVVNSTGTVTPKQKVAIGSFVSGPILEIYADFNDEVKKDQLLAKIDPLLYEANFERDKASYASREADVLRVRAQLQQAINDEKRAIALRKEDPSFIAQAEMDKYKFARLSLEAQLVVAETAAQQAKATMDSTGANLKYTDIVSPVDGMIIDRKINQGQTVAASFQTPELFTVAPDMRKEINVHASVDEADIGLIKAAQAHEYPVTFTVDAYPDELFEGRIYEVRLSPTVTQNVVTYPVIVTAPNAELKLLPGMTASLSFQVAFRNEVIKVPNGALRYYPDPKHVRPEDIPILEGHQDTMGNQDDDDAQQNSKQMSADERTQLRKQRDRRHVWIQEGNLLRAVAVSVGLSDSKYSELVEGDLEPGQKVVTGIQQPRIGAAR
ncbi:efflux RND transporter periplasmic adaptor subunit [Schlesneria paludicola]|uniref:efflux RND transporter periplasmic adaptor subunit n=1 Tax=Schlesneria paludicola TaxID=360056 RepID=UPI000299F6AB|nr:efflux RND transporter periplasmic adaptor subunit [Schlesneria paludicola]